MRQAAALPAEARIQGLDKIAGLTPGMAEADSDAAIDQYLDRLLRGHEARGRGGEAGTPRQDAGRDRGDEGQPSSTWLWHSGRSTSRCATREKRRLGAASRIRPRYARALLAETGGLLAPDANSTLRVTYGQVKARSNAADGVDWRAFTTLAGIERKHTGQGEFRAPAAELEAIRALREGRTSRYVVPELGDVPVDFLSTVDTTGGNSGSPTLNARGELVGLLFDGTFDTVASDYVYDAVRTRSIHVDVRYLLWVMGEVDGAARLVEEMGVR